MGTTHPMDTDPDLLRRFADSRDQAAFAELVSRHLGLVHATALRLLGGDAHLAQDVAQGTFTELARQASALRGRDTLAGWLHHTARFLALNAVRAERRRREREQEAHAMNETDTTPDAAWALFAPVLDDAIAALHEADRDALLLRYFQDKSHREVGAHLGLGEDAARMRVARALDKLRAHFSKRGVTTTAALLSLTLGVHGSTPAPAGLAASIATKSLATVAGGAVAVGAAKTLLTVKWFTGVAAIFVALTVVLLWPTPSPSPAQGYRAELRASIPPTPAQPQSRRGRGPTLPAAAPPPPLPPKRPAMPPPAPAFATNFESAATSVNQTGLNLFWLVSSADPDSNVLLSPYSIQSALAMTYAGADGETRAEMARVLNFPDDDAVLADSFNGLHANLADAVTKSAQAIAARVDGVRRGTRAGSVASAASVQPIEWHVANRLFGQPDYEFRPVFLDMVRDRYTAPFQPLDFRADPEPARLFINQWVAEQTKDKILDLIPPRTLGEATRLVLVNALYFKAPWETSFRLQSTQYQSFKVRGTTPVDVPTMRQNELLGYAKRKGFTAVTLPYLGGALQFLILLPDDPAGVDALAAAITPATLRENAQLETQRISLSLPKFKIQAPTIKLAETLKTLGMKTAFDLPSGSANFDRMAPRKPKDYLFISEVLHKTFLSLDEEGTEAAAATAVIMLGRGGPPRSTEVRVDHPFLFAIQHRESGMCLFFGRVTDPQWPAGPGAVAPKQRPGDPLPGF